MACLCVFARRQVLGRSERQVYRITAKIRRRGPKESFMAIEAASLLDSFR